ncbi:hypothetical protein Ancab_039368, partial [Ancistrocladus abbreviatus]
TSWPPLMHSAKQTDPTPTRVQRVPTQQIEDAIQDNYTTPKSKVNISQVTHHGPLHTMLDTCLPKDNYEDHLLSISEILFPAVDNPEELLPIEDT